MKNLHIIRRTLAGVLAGLIVFTSVPCDVWASEIIDEANETLAGELLADGIKAERTDSGISFPGEVENADGYSKENINDSESNYDGAFSEDTKISEEMSSNPENSEKIDSKESDETLESEEPLESEEALESDETLESDSDSESEEDISLEEATESDETIDSEEVDSEEVDSEEDVENKDELSLMDAEAGEPIVTNINIKEIKQVSDIEGEIYEALTQEIGTTKVYSYTYDSSESRCTDVLSAKAYKPETIDGETPEESDYVQVSLLEGKKLKVSTGFKPAKDKAAIVVVYNDSFETEVKRFYINTASPLWINTQPSVSVATATDTGFKLNFSAPAGVEAIDNGYYRISVAANATKTKLPDDVVVSDEVYYFAAKDYSVIGNNENFIFAYK